MVRIGIGAGRVVFDERQPDRLMAGSLKVVFARSVWRQRVSGTVQQSPVGVVERFDEELALARVLGVARRFVVDEQYLKNDRNHLCQSVYCDTVLNIYRSSVTGRDSSRKSSSV